MRTLILPALALTALGLSACSEKAADQVEQAGDAIGNDIERGINNADDHIDAGLDSAGRAIDNAGDHIGAAADEAGRKADAASHDARQEAGNALKKAGEDLKN